MSGASSYEERMCIVKKGLDYMQDSLRAFSDRDKSGESHSVEEGGYQSSTSSDDTSMTKEEKAGQCGQRANVSHR